MVDFNGNEIKIGSKVFWLHKPSEPLIGIVSEFRGKKTFLVKLTDVIKFSKKVKEWYDEYKISNPDDDTDRGFGVNSDHCIVIE